ncbi:myelin protein zero-like protein 3 [Lepisosteus oculatus]|uniref:myelin protein zero-like protein 3 n=1 Tax=Lepisosteus oculatus TaxID=7918 RepID=UPI0037159A6C
MGCLTPQTDVLLRCFLLVFAAGGGAAIQVSAPPEVVGVKGREVTLKCTFWSSIHGTKLLSVDWSFRPESGGPSQSLFHFQSIPYPPTEGRFKDRVTWVGDIPGGDASISLRNLSLTDNGTFSCVVRNPPDVHVNPAQTVLTVTRQDTSLRFTSFFALVVLVLFPSAVILLVQLGRMCCSRFGCGEGKRRDSKACPIEVIDREDTAPKKPTLKDRIAWCCFKCFQDSDYEDYDVEEPLRHHEPVAESHC